MAVFEASKPLRQISIDIEDPKGEALVIRIGGAGMCRTDLRLWQGTEPRPGFKLPFVLGHENAGRVYDIGDHVSGLKKGDDVIVYAVWGDLSCGHCREGNLMLCREQKVAGQSYYYGGYAEFMYVPSYRYVYRITGMDPVEAAPLADAGITSYSAVRKLLPFLYPGCAVVAYGVGGLASYGIQILKALAPTVKIIAVSRSKEKLDWASKLGADASVEPSGLKDVVESETSGVGAIAAIDFVGTAESTTRLAGCLEAGGAIIEVGMEGEALSIPTFNTTVWQHYLIGSNYGTFEDLSRVVELARRGIVRAHLSKRALSQASDALSELKEGHVLGRFVLTP